MVAQRVSKRRRQAGFTLIEVMVAILLTAIAIIGILALYMTQTRASSYSRHQTEASVLASDGIERLRTITAPIVGAPVTEVGLTEQGKPGGAFDRTSTVTPSGVDFNLQVDVTWYENSQLKTVTLYGRR